MVTRGVAADSMTALMSTFTMKPKQDVWSDSDWHGPVAVEASMCLAQVWVPHLTEAFLGSKGFFLVFRTTDEHRQIYLLPCTCAFFCACRRLLFFAWAHMYVTSRMYAYISSYVILYHVHS